MWANHTTIRPRLPSTPPSSGGQTTPSTASSASGDDEITITTAAVINSNLRELKWRLNKLHLDFRALGEWRDTRYVPKEEYREPPTPPLIGGHSAPHPAPGHAGPTVHSNSEDIRPSFSASATANPKYQYAPACPQKPRSLDADGAMGDYPPIRASIKRKVAAISPPSSPASLTRKIAKNSQAGPCAALMPIYVPLRDVDLNACGAPSAAETTFASASGAHGIGEEGKTGWNKWVREESAWFKGATSASGGAAQ